MITHEQNKSPPPDEEIDEDIPEEEIYRLLLKHQRWLNSNGRFGMRLDQEDLYFGSLELDGIDLSYARIPGAHFEGCSVREGRFIGAYMLDATFESCDVAKADFTEADLSWSTFSADTNHEQACFARASTYKIAWTLEEGAKNEFDYAISLLTNTPGIVP